MASEPSSSLAAATGRLLGQRASFTAEPQRVTIDARDARMMIGGLRALPDGIGDQAARTLTLHLSDEGISLSIADCWALVRALTECERVVTRRRRLERGILPGTLSAREVMIVSRKLNGKP